MKKNNFYLLFFALILSVVMQNQAIAEKGSVSKTEKIDVSELDLQNGDLIFQSLGGKQGNALKLALQSKINHVGMVYIKDAEIFVIEAAAKVKLTPIKKYLKRNKGHFEVKRLKNAAKKLTKANWKKIVKECEEHLDKPYDIYFNWDDDKFYCSELVWKIYNKCLGIKLGNLKKLKEFDLSHPLVKNLLKERYGDNPPLDDSIISPDSMYDSKDLETVIKN